MRARGHAPTRAPGRRYLDPATLRRLQNLLFVARTIVEGSYAGRHRSRLRGHSVEFADYREYCPGDDISDIDWKAYGRTDRLYVKLFEAHTDMVVYTLLDGSASMAYAGLANTPSIATYPWRQTAPPPISKFDYAAQLLAALAYLTIKQQDRLALGLFGEQLDVYEPPGGTFAHLKTVLNRMEQYVPGGKTNLPEVLHRTFGVIRQRGVLVIVSDFLDDIEPLFDALHRFRHHRFEIILFQVLHAEERHLPATPSARFIDSESHQPLTTFVPDVRTAYERELTAHLDALRRRCVACGIDYNLATTDTPYEQVLERYLVQRAAVGV
jgi:uncharacterized protein (DUF58 family)